MARRSILLALVLALAACSSAPASMVGDAGVIEDAGVAPDAGAFDAGVADAEVSMRTVRSYVALGSSSTAGAGASRPENAYVERLHARLLARFPDMTATNLGAGGATVGSFLRNLDRVRAARPDLVTILPLTDSVSTSTAAFERGYAELLDGLGALGATVFFGDHEVDPQLICGVGSGPNGCYSRADYDMLRAKGDVLARLAATRPFVVVVPALDQNVAHPEWISGDGAHPNDLGHQHLADVFWAPISRWLDGQ